ncbi:MAG: NAD(+) diphosphatase [Hyphomicrobiaceae bacterium]
MPTVAATTLLDRVSPKRADEAWIGEQRASSDGRYLIFCDLKPVVASSPDRSHVALRWHSRDDVATMGLDKADAMFLGLGRQTQVPYFAIAITEAAAREIPDGFSRLRPSVDLRSLAMQGQITPEEQSLAGQARALGQWHENARCCGRCGAPTAVKDAGWRRKCTGCGLDWFPRTDPVVIMLVTDGERCILAHEHRYQGNMYSTLAGFLEPGEDIEHAVRREVLEETSIQVGRVDYFRSQPWPFPHSLMMGCIAHAETTDIVVDTSELADARWFTRDEARAMLANAHPDGLTAPGKHAIAHILIRAFVDGQTG